MWQVGILYGHHVLSPKLLFYKLVESKPLYDDIKNIYLVKALMQIEVLNNDKNCSCYQLNSHIFQNLLFSTLLIIECNKSSNDKNNSNSNN